MESLDSSLTASKRKPGLESKVQNQKFRCIWPPIVPSLWGLGSCRKSRDLFRWVRIISWYTQNYFQPHGTLPQRLHRQALYTFYLLYTLQKALQQLPSVLIQLLQQKEQEGDSVWGLRFLPFPLRSPSFFSHPMLHTTNKAIHILEISQYSRLLKSCNILNLFFFPASGTHTSKSLHSLRFYSPNGEN